MLKSSSILFFLLPLLGFSQSNLNGISKSLYHDITVLEKMGEGYYKDGEFKLSEQSYFAAKKKARELGDLALEIKISFNYSNKFVHIGSLAKNIELILELKEQAINQKNDSLIFITNKMIIQQYVTLGTKIEIRQEIARSMLDIAKKMNDSLMLSTAYSSLGSAYEGNEAIFYYRKSLNYLNWKKDKHILSSIFNNLSARYRFEGDFQSALNCADSAYLASKEVGRLEGMAASRYRSAEAYFLMNEFYKTIDYGKEALKMFNEAGILRRQDQCAKIISESYKELGDYKSALFYYEMGVQLKDSLKIQSDIEAAEFVDRKYAYESVQKRDSTTFAQERLLNKLEIENMNNVLSKERMQKYFLYSGSTMVLIFAIFIWISFQRKRKDNNIIESQKLLVEEKNQEITDSIHYAKRIQNAILPPIKVVKEYLQESFILYKPKDIVAGDFYWLEHKDGKVLFAAADCTGHGVPGAMVSVVCNNALNRSVREYGLTDPGEILNKTREIVVQEFEKSEDEVKDGMDIAFCSISADSSSSGAFRKLKYAGANNPLWIIRNNEIIETSANKQPIGKFDNPLPYTTHLFELQKGDSIYIFSDGYVDQFGGEKGKKFKAKAFRELLLSIQEKSMEEQRKSIDESFETWKGDLEQVDDVCVIGVRI